MLTSGITTGPGHSGGEPNSPPMPAGGSDPIGSSGSLPAAMVTPPVGGSNGRNSLPSPVMRVLVAPLYTRASPDESWARTTTSADVSSSMYARLTDTAVPTPAPNGA